MTDTDIVEKYLELERQTAMMEFKLKLTKPSCQVDRLTEILVKNQPVSTQHSMEHSKGTTRPYSPPSIQKTSLHHSAGGQDDITIKACVENKDG